MFTGKLVRLREYRESDLEKALQFVNQADVSLNLYPTVPFPYTLEDERKWLSSQSARNPDYNFAIEDLATGTYIGGCGLKGTDWKNRNTEIGIMIGHEEYRNRGYGPDALNVLIRFIFGEMNLYKIKLNVFSFNKRAIRCYEKCGFLLEATLKDEIFRDGRYHDIFRMVRFREKTSE
ncbi:MAG: GNAT family N-acetyltransferase [Opitutales bacterium]|nr:GNAT family N-acetyltransferase [Opitutales bacterium]